MRLAERLTTIAATATLTSAGWIVAGGLWLTHQSPAPAPVAAPAQVAAAGVGTAEQVPSAPAAAAANAAGLIIPVAGIKPGQLVDSFNEPRGGGRRHGAIDIMAPRGTPVVAAAAGTVEKLFHSDAGGNTIYVRSPDKTTINYYAHLDHYADGLREGQSVAQGQAIGAVGSTGDASPDAPHLHFEIMRTTPNAKWYQPATQIDPYPLLTGKQP
ncbi:MAG: M23 family metallopeptidase [Porphyrobacter sp.]|nr:M23 family metallopeptidase [Porphyrobacter sp.]